MDFVHILVGHGRADTTVLVVIDTCVPRPRCCAGSARWLGAMATRFAVVERVALLASARSMLLEALSGATHFTVHAA